MSADMSAELREKRRQRDGREPIRWALRASAAGLLVAVLAWLSVELWLVDRESADAVEITGVAPILPSIESTRGEPKRPEREGAAPGGVANSIFEDQWTVPVHWHTRPRSFPKAGFVIVLDGAGDQGSAGPAIEARLFSNDLRLPRDTPANVYFLRSQPPVAFPHALGLRLQVDQTSVRIRSRLPFVQPTAIDLYYTIPVRLVLEADDLENSIVVVRCDPLQSQNSGSGFLTKATLTPGVEYPVFLPRGILRFDMPISANDSGVGRLNSLTSSLGTRIPEVDEVVTLRSVGLTTLNITLKERRVGALATIFGESLQTGGDPLLNQLPKLWISITGWQAEGRASTYEAVWKELPLQNGPPPVVSARVPGIEGDIQIGLQVTAQFSLDRGPASARLIAFADASIRGGFPFYEVIAEVLDLSWTLRVSVRTLDERPVPDFIVSARPQIFLSGRMTYILFQKSAATNRQGELEFAGMPANQGACITIRPGVPIDRALNPDFTGSVWFRPTQLETELRIVVPNDHKRPLTLCFDEQGESGVQSPIATQRAARLEYIIIPARSNLKLAADVSSVPFPPTRRLVTAIRERGRYSCLLSTPWGEILLDVNYDGDANSEVTVPISVPREIAVTCLDSDKRPLSGAVVFTSGIEPSIAWGITSAMSRGVLNHFGRQSFSRGGTARFACQPKNLNPRHWLLYDSKLGVCRAQSQVELGDSIELQGVERVACADLSIRVDTWMLDPAHQHIVCISPIFCAGADSVSGIFAFLGETKNIMGRDTICEGLPEGEYAVSILRASADGVHTPLGAKFSRIVRILSSEALLLDFTK